MAGACEEMQLFLKQANTGYDAIIEGVLKMSPSYHHRS
jgi:hypothetical protein